MEAVGRLQPVSAAQDFRSLPTQKVELSNAPLPQPSHSQALDFERAVAARPVHEVRAAPVPASFGWTGGVANQLDSLASHLRVLSADQKPLESSPDFSPSSELKSKDVATDAVTQMERVYMLAIEATMASRASTEATKIFNTLLKGQ
jgi:hypothetical protein